MSITDAPDHCSSAGAARLAQRIEAYWHERGGEVKCRVENIGMKIGNGGNATYIAVRSDMVAGVPCHG